MFNMVSIMTGQGIQLLGMLTEAIHTLIHDRYLAIEMPNTFLTMLEIWEMKYCLKKME